MNIDPLFMTIGLVALAVAIWLKLDQNKRKRRMREIMERAQVVAARAAVKPETRGKVLAAEREFGRPVLNCGKRWDV